AYHAALPPLPVRRPPGPTHFPYTTLFRSEGAREALANGRHDGEEDQQHAGQEEVARESDQLLLHVGSLARLTRGPARAAGARRQIGRAQSELQSRENLVCRLLLEKKQART